MTDRENVRARFEREIEADDVENLGGGDAVPHLLRFIRQLAKEIEWLRSEVEELRGR